MTRRACFALAWAQPIPIPVAQFEGTVKALEKSRLILELPDGNTLTFTITRKTKGARDVKPGDTVTVDAVRAPDASLDAVVIKKR